MPFCDKCGKELTTGAGFCMNCGASITGAPAETKTSVSGSTVSRRRFIMIAGAAAAVLVAGGAGYYALTKEGPSGTQKVSTTAVTRSSSATSSRATDPFLGVSAPQRLLIIAPDDFIPALQPLVQHKNQTGMPTVALSISSLKAWPNFKGVDDPETIKKAIQYAHEKLNTSYMMLVGDAHKFPVRFYFIHNVALGDWSKWTNPETQINPYGTWVPSDLYYANLYHHTGKYPNLAAGSFDNWDANGNGLYNEVSWSSALLGRRSAPDPNVDNVDGYPDVAVGRVTAHTAADVAAYVNKIVGYETTPARYQALPRQFTFVADKQLNMSVDQTSTMMKDTGLTENGLVSARFLLIENYGSPGCLWNLSPNAPEPPFIPAPPGWTNATAADVANAANVSNWVFYNGHGEHKGWGACGKFGPNDVAQTANSTALPVVYASGCNTGGFLDYMPWSISEYVDTSGNRHGPFKVNGSTLLDGSKPCTLPVNIPTPNAYDFDRGDQGFAYPWLIANAPGGAMAYFGEMGYGGENPPGTELMTSMLKSYALAPESKPILGDIYLKAQQQYWGNRHNDNTVVDVDPKLGDFIPSSIPRLYLGWVTFFGDPSLRLPPIRK